MTTENYSSIHLHIKLCGYGYTSDVGDDVRNALESTSNLIVRVEWAPAALPCLLIEYFIEVLQETPKEVITSFILYAMKKTYDAVKQKIIERGQYPPETSLVQMSTKLYDIAIYCDQINDEIDYGLLLNKIDCLVCLESMSNRRIKKVSLPVSQQSDKEYYCGRFQADCNSSLWAIEYEEATLYDNCIYDEVNEHFLENVEITIE